MPFRYLQTVSASSSTRVRPAKAKSVTLCVIATWFFVHSFGIAITSGATTATRPTATSGPAEASLQAEKSDIVVALSSIAGGGASLWVAADRGYFKRYGMDVKVIYTRPITGIQSTVAGETTFAHIACPEIMTATRAGADLTLIGATIHYSFYIIASRPDITDVRQLVGKRLAINQLQDTTHFSARFALKEAGINPDSVNFLQVGSTPERLTALKSGSVDAALQSSSSIAAIKDMGLNILLNLFERRLPYCGNGISVSRSFLRANPRTVEGFMRAFVHGVAYVRDGSPDRVRAIMAKYMRTQPNDKNLRSAYEYYRDFYPKNPVVPKDGISFVLKMFGERDNSWSQWKPEQFYDNSIMDKLTREGFLGEVYKQVKSES